MAHTNMHKHIHADDQLLRLRAREKFPNTWEKHDKDWLSLVKEKPFYIRLVPKELITEEMLINSEDAPEEDMEIEPLDEAVADAATLTKIEVVVTEPDTWVNVTVDE